MILLQLSSGQGPDECARAVAFALQKIQRQAQLLDVQIQLMETIKGEFPNCFKSAFLKLSGKEAETLARQWQGSMLWVCHSPFRPRHKRKNWFFSGHLYHINTEKEADSQDNDIRYKTCKASGAGGQHVNTTDSAVQATHIPSGISVKVSSERSQHANKKLARLIIAAKLNALSEKRSAQEQRTRREQHWQLERGNPNRVFQGEKFQPVQ